MLNPKYITLNDNIYEYIGANHSNANDALLRDLQEETARLGGISEMQISADQGTFMSLFVAAIGARSAIEVGTFTGYSSICIARGLAAGGKLLCCDQSEEWTSVARKYWQRAGLQDTIELRLGSGADTLRALEPDREFDFAFIDADKSGYDTYYELILPRMRPNGVLIFDNMLRHGRVAATELSNPDDIAVNALNHKLAADPRIEAVLLPVADGLQVCRKRA